MYLNFFLNNKTTKTEKKVDVVAWPEIKLKLCGLIKVLKESLICGSLLGRNLAVLSLIRFTN